MLLFDVHQQIKINSSFSQMDLPLINPFYDFVKLGTKKLF